MLVYIHRNYSYPNLLRQTPNCSGEWEGIKFTFDNVEKADYIVVLNHPLEDIRMTCLKEGKFLIVQEPPYPENNYFKLHFRFYDKIIAGFSGPHIINTQASLPWHVNKNYDELVALTEDKLINKKDIVSWVTSNNNLFPAHQTRLNFVDFLKRNGFPFDLFGRGFAPINDKFDAIFPYKYTIAAENYIGDNYFTEKILDAFLSWTMPIYYGSGNITNYFPAESMIQINLNNTEESLEKIKEAIANKLWDKNIEAIRYSRELVLKKYQLFPFVHELIKNNSIITNSSIYEKVFLPKSGLTKMESIKKKIKGAFKNNS